MSPPKTSTAFLAINEASRHHSFVRRIIFRALISDQSNPRAITRDRSAKSIAPTSSKGNPGPGKMQKKTPATNITTPATG
jgi:hypothetical protein